MLQHYLIIAIRNFFKYKLQTVISITGLAIGLVCFAYGINWLKYETSYVGIYGAGRRRRSRHGALKGMGRCDGVRREPRISKRVRRRDRADEVLRKSPRRICDGVHQ